MSEVRNTGSPRPQGQRDCRTPLGRWMLPALPLLVLALWLGFRASGPAAVRPTAQTAPMLGKGDVADDTCLWVHPRDGARSVLFGTNKSEDRSGGIYAFRLDGSRWGGGGSWRSEVNWFDPGRKINNVDGLRGFPAGETKWDIIAAANRTDRSLDVFRVHTDPQGEFSGLELVGRIPVGTGFGEGTGAPYGLALALWTPPDSPAASTPRGDTGLISTAAQGSDSIRCMAFASDTRGRVAQYELQFRASGTGTDQVTARRLDDGGKPWQISEADGAVEGLVADMSRDTLYIASENEGIFRYRLKHGVLDPQSKIVIDRVGPRLKADVEGLALYARADGTGFLIASSQGSSRFAVYRREFNNDAPNAPVTSFKVGRGERIGAVGSTDGIEVVAANLGGAFREGLFVAHDGDGDSPSNYKLVPWSAIIAIGVR